MADLATLRIVVDASGAIRVVDQFGNATEKAAKQTDALEKAAKRASTVLGGTLVAGLALAVKETADAQREQAALATILDRTGQAAGRSLDQLNAHADALRRVTAFGGGDIAEAQARLLSYTGVTGAAFDRATKVALDWATAYGGTAVQAAEAIGRALNFPTRGLEALSKQGFIFTDSQKAVIEGLVETNRLAEAQGIILRELESVLDGQAAAYRNTLGGALAAVKESFLELFEIPGGEGMNRLVESINRIADGFGLVRNSIQLAVAEFDLFLASNNEAFLKGLSYTTFGVLGNDGAGSGFDLETQINRRAAAEQRIRQLTNERPGLAARITEGAAARRGATLGTLGSGTGSGSGTGLVTATKDELDAVADLIRQHHEDAAKAFAFRMEREAAAQERLADIEAQRQAKALAGFKAQLDAAKHVDDTLTRKSLGALKGALADVKDGTDVLTESARVFTEQTQLALGRFASDFLKDGFRSLDRFWDDFLQLGRDAIGNVFAKSVMERFGDTLGDKLGGLLGGLGGTGAGILGAVGAGFAVGLDKIFGESKWERAAEEHQRAARAMQEAASELKMSTQASQARWLDDFLNYANDETPIARELRNLTNRRNDLAMQALGIARTATHGAALSSPYAQGLISRNDWTALAAEARHQAAQGNLFDDGRRALLDFADALDLLNAALVDNREAALRASDAQQELTLAQFRDELGADATGQLSASQRLAEAQRQYDAILALAQGGDASAVDSLPETARTLIDAARETFASGVRYQELFAGVQADVDALLAAVRARTALPHESIVPSPVGFADSIAAPDLSPVTDALAVQADRALAVANAQLAVQQEGFTAVTGALLEVRGALSQLQYTLRTGVVIGEA